MAHTPNDANGEPPKNEGNPEEGPGGVPPTAPRGVSFKRWWVCCGICGVEQPTHEENHRRHLNKARESGWVQHRTYGWICPDRPTHREIWHLDIPTPDQQEHAYREALERGGGSKADESEVDEN